METFYFLDYKEADFFVSKVIVAYNVEVTSNVDGIVKVRCDEQDYTSTAKIIRAFYNGFIARRDYRTSPIE